VQYFNDDPSSSSSSLAGGGIDCSNIAVSTRLMNASMNKATSTMDMELGLRKLCKVRSIELFIEGVPTDDDHHQQCHHHDHQMNPKPIIKLSSELSIKVKLIKKCVDGMLVLHGIDVNSTLPNIDIKCDASMLRSLSTILELYSNYYGVQHLSSSRHAAKDGHLSSSSLSIINSNNIRYHSSSSMMHQILHTDPTLRTLLWLEEQARNEDDGSSSSSSSRDHRRDASIVIDDDDSQSHSSYRRPGDSSIEKIDYQKIAQLMRKVQHQYNKYDLHDHHYHHNLHHHYHHHYHHHHHHHHYHHNHHHHHRISHNISIAIIIINNLHHYHYRHHYQYHKFTIYFSLSIFDIDHLNYVPLSLIDIFVVSKYKRQHRLGFTKNFH